MLPSVCRRDACGHIVHRPLDRPLVSLTMFYFAIDLWQMEYCSDMDQLHHFGKATDGNLTA